MTDWILATSENHIKHTIDVHLIMCTYDFRMLPESNQSQQKVKGWIDRGNRESGFIYIYRMIHIPRGGSKFSLMFGLSNQSLKKGMFHYDYPGAVTCLSY